MLQHDLSENRIPLFRNMRSTIGSRRPRPRPALPVRCLEGGDASGVAVGHVDIVPAVEQLIAADRVDAESEAPVAARDCLFFEIDGDRHVRIGRDRGAELSHIGFRQHGRQQSILDGVLREDIAEGRRDHAADAGFVKRIDRRFARRAAAEIPPGDQDPRVAPDRLVERKVRSFVALGVAPQIMEQHPAELARARQF